MGSLKICPVEKNVPVHSVPAGTPGLLLNLSPTCLTREEGRLQVGGSVVVVYIDLLILILIQGLNCPGWAMSFYFSCPSRPSIEVS